MHTADPGAWKQASQVLQGSDTDGGASGDATASNNGGLNDAEVTRVEGAVKQLNQSAQLFAKADNKGGAGNALSTLGMAFTLMGKSKDAVAVYKTAIPMLEAADAVHGTAQASRARMLLRRCSVRGAVAALSMEMRLL